MLYYGSGGQGSTGLDPPIRWRWGETHTSIDLFLGTDFHNAARTPLSICYRVVNCEVEQSPQHEAPHRVYR